MSTFRMVKKKMKLILTNTPSTFSLLPVATDTFVNKSNFLITVLLKDKNIKLFIVKKNKTNKFTLIIIYKNHNYFLCLPR